MKEKKTVIKYIIGLGGVSDASDRSTTNMEMLGRTCENLELEERTSITQRANAKIKELTAGLTTKFAKLSASTLHSSNSFSFCVSKESFASDCTSEGFQFEVIIESIMKNLDAASMSLCCGVLLS